MSGLREAGFGGRPVERNFRMRDTPLGELRFAHVRRKSLHNLTVRNLADKIVKRLLIFPSGKRPEFARKGFCFECVADHAWCDF